jgi:predicted AlkP superfamily phosphohydrolase/phosphomutase
MSPELKRIYGLMDDIVSDVMTHCDDGKTDIVVFSPFSLAPVWAMMSVNCWLAEQGFLTFKEGAEQGWRLADVDWTKTRAYSLGDGNIYLNLQGREPQGIVRPEERRGVSQALFDRLLDWQDPFKHIVVKHIKVPGVQAINADMKLNFPPIEQPSETSAPCPDIMVFFEKGLQAVPEGIFDPGEVRDDFRFRPPPHYYRGHTSVAIEYVPGFLVTSRILDRTEASLLDLAPTALDFFDCPIPEGMEGKSLW